MRSAPSMQLSFPVYADGFPIAANLFPLDGGRRLRANVVNDPVDSLDLIDDPARNPPEHLVREREPVGSHAVGAGNGAQTEDVLIGSLVPHHTDASYRQQYRKSLPYLVVESGFPDFFQIHGVGGAE